MALEQKLNLRMSQRLIMTPSLQQAIKLLQMTKLELQEEITQEVTENPLLEEIQEAPAEGDKPEAEEAGESAEGEAAVPEVPAGEEREKDSFEEIDYESYFQDYMDMSYIPQAPAEEIEAPPLENVLTKPQSLADHLLWQLDMTVCTPRQKEIARAIIGNLDDDGYLQASLEEIVAMGPYAVDEVEGALHLVQELDPTGV
ncbi:MAG TPA: RNA polymerase sigma-54 factor, partial [Candidatus Polarisedimenticolia bacterium]|nr:RNA polymerase sigma-54 factor [Candidatus Polarisedimenticolia bacterium]